MRRRLLTICLILVSCLTLHAEEADTLARHWGGNLNVSPGWAIVMDKYQKKWQKGRHNFSFGGEVTYSALRSDSDVYAAAFGYPTISLGVKYSLNHGVTMHRSTDPDWGLAEEVDYDSYLGNSLAVYGSFARPFFRNHRWETDYAINIGVGFSPTKYNPVYNVDNEMIGARWLIFFGAGFHASYRVAKDWGLKVGLDYWHLSNGALNRPNKGANILGPSLALVYEPYYKDVVLTDTALSRKAFRRYVYLNFTAGVGGKSLNEDWQKTQFQTRSDDPEYRTSTFPHYMAYSFQADVMYRYHRKWASGIGFDVFYGTYASHVQKMDEAKGLSIPHSPWSLGIAFKHQVFYHNVSMSMSVGPYLYRRMGDNAKRIEKPFYERIGLQYTIPHTGGLSVGGYVKAHLAKADFTEFVVAYPIVLW